MTGGGSLAELLDALAPPLEYLAADGFRQAARTRLPLRTLAERVARARADAAPGVDRALGELDEVLAALGQAAPDARAALLRRAHALLPQLAAARARGPSTGRARSRSRRRSRP